MIEFENQNLREIDKVRNRKPRLKFFCFGIILSLTFISKVFAAEVKAPKPETLTAITNRGVLLSEYDLVAADGTDAFQKATKNDPPGSTHYDLYLGRKTPGGWKVGFGKLKTNFQFDLKSEFVIDVPNKRVVQIFVPANAAIYAPMALAVINCMKVFKAPGPDYNYAILPADNGQFYVYFYPGTRISGQYLLGGDVRYLVSKDGKQILETRQMHKSVISYPRSGLPAGTIPAAGMHSAILHDEPEDTDVMHVLLRKPKIPEFVATKNWLYEISTSGDIVVKPAKK